MKCKDQFLNRNHGRGSGPLGPKSLISKLVTKKSEAMLRFVAGLLALLPFTLAFVASPLSLSGLRSKQCSGVLSTSMVSAAKKSYSRQFGFPAVTAGKLAGEATAVKKTAAEKGEGWKYRAPKSDKFEDGSKFWARIEASERNAKIDVKRYHNTKTVG